MLVSFSHVGWFSHCWTLLTPLIPIRIGRACSWYLHGNHQKRPACVDASGWVGLTGVRRHPTHPILETSPSGEMQVVPHKNSGWLWSLKTIQAIWGDSEKLQSRMVAKVPLFGVSWRSMDFNPYEVGTRRNQNRSAQGLPVKLGHEKLAKRHSKIWTPKEIAINIAVIVTKCHKYLVHTSRCPPQMLCWFITCYNHL